MDTDDPLPGETPAQHFKRNPRGRVRWEQQQEPPPRFPDGTARLIQAVMGDAATRRAA